MEDGELKICAISENVEFRAIEVDFFQDSSIILVIINVGG